MALEDLVGADKGLNDLVASNPDGLDPKSEGDNHLRGLKNVLLNSFGPMEAISVSTPQVGELATWDGTKYAPTPPIPGVLTGTILDYGAAAVPAGYLACDGVPVSRTTYAALFAVIGTTWGIGDGVNSFNTPALSRRATIGTGGVAISGPAATIGSYGGAETHVLSSAEMPSHIHQDSALITGTGGAVAGKEFRGDGTAPTALNSDPTGGGGAHNNMQPCAVVRKIIKT